MKKMLNKVIRYAIPIIFWGVCFACSVDIMLQHRETYEFWFGLGFNVFATASTSAIITALAQSE